MFLVFWRRGQEWARGQKQRLITPAQELFHVDRVLTAWRKWLKSQFDEFRVGS